MTAFDSIDITYVSGHKSAIDISRICEISETIDSRKKCKANIYVDYRDVPLEVQESKESILAQIDLKLSVANDG